MAYEKYQRWKTQSISAAPFLSIVVPAYNEEIRILPAIGVIASYVSDLGFPWELIIADDGSKDNTVRVVEELGFANLRVLRAPKNEGKGGAVRRGMLAARGQYILFADADNSTPIEELSKLLEKVSEAGYDIAIGSRAALGAAEANKSLLRRWLSDGLRLLVRTIFHIGVRDTQCGFKIFTHAAAQRLYRAQTITGFSFDLEIIYLANKLHLQIAEVPVAWVDAPGSKVDPAKEIQRFLRDLVKIKLNDLKGVYANA